MTHDSSSSPSRTESFPGRLGRPSHAIVALREGARVVVATPATRARGIATRVDGDGRGCETEGRARWGARARDARARAWDRWTAND